MYGSNLGPAHIHAVARRTQYLQDAERSRQARLAPRPASRTQELRKAAGRAIVALGLRLHGDLPQPRHGCLACEARAAS